MLGGMWAAQLVFLRGEHLSHPLLWDGFPARAEEIGWEMIPGAGMGVLEPGAPGVPAGDLFVSPVNH